MIKVSNLNLTINDYKGNRLQLFKNLSFKVKKGEFVAVVGPAKCGKSTLIRIMGDLFNPSANTELSGDIDINGKTPREARQLNYFSYVFKEPVLLVWRTVRENLEVPSEIMTRSNQLDSKQILNLLNLKEAADLYPYEISPIMQQRISLARALSLNPKVLFLDDPLAELAAADKNNIYSERLRICKEFKLTTVMTTTNIEEAVKLADRVIVLSKIPSIVIHEELIPKQVKAESSKQMYRKTVNKINNLLLNE